VVVRIRYYDEAGELLFTRKRNPPRVEPRFLQPAKTDPRPYGLDPLPDARKAGHLWLVEGESVSWVLWSAGEPELGNPGGSSTRGLTAEDVAGILHLRIVCDRDQTGKKFLAGLTERLTEIGYDGEVVVVELPAEVGGVPVKD